MRLTLWLYIARRFLWTVVAAFVTVLMLVMVVDMVELIRSNSDASMRLLADISKRLHDRVREIENLTIQNARTRLVSYMMDHLVGPPVDDQATARLDLPRHVIASRLSIQPETLSRLLRNLADEGIVSVDDRVVFIRSVSRLRPYD